MNQIEAEVHADQRMAAGVVPVAAVARILREADRRIERSEVRVAEMSHRTAGAQDLREVDGKVADQVRNIREPAVAAATEGGQRGVQVVAPSVRQAQAPLQRSG